MPAVHNDSAGHEARVAYPRCAAAEAPEVNQEAGYRQARCRVPALAG